MSIYDPLDARTDLFLDNERLEQVLNDSLRGANLDYKLRTRSKVAKSLVCTALGYPAPKMFLRTRPRFPGQNFDAFVQKANNLQIWNDEIAGSRRYVLIRVDSRQVVTKVRVISGEILAELDTTGTLTQKYQARSRSPVDRSILVSKQDTEPVRSLLGQRQSPLVPGLLRISEVYRRLRRLLGSELPLIGFDQERNRGSGLHAAVAKALGCHAPTETGQFPDILPQLLELKLQTSPTIDLGLVSPDDRHVISDLPPLRHCDVRYAVFYGTAGDRHVRLEHLIVATGADFFTFFRRFEGRITNKKLQIHLPVDFFD